MTSWKLLFALVLFLAHAGRVVDAAEAPKPLAPLPSTSQLAWQEDELALFVHFGMNTFTGRSTGLGTEDPRLFAPANLDCRQWVQIAEETGFNGIILTAKHHDGFCLWPTTTTDYSVKSSAWKNGNGDVVRELADACKGSSVKLGIYCAPWDRRQPTYESDRAAYATIYRQQLTELLSNYGPVYEMWFDGNRANIADWPTIVATVRKLQPHAVIKQGPRLPDILEDVRWVGNELACAPLDNWSVYPPPQTNASERTWFPVQCNATLVGHPFWDGRPPINLATLMNYYYTSVGRNSTLLLKVAVNKEGRLSPETVGRLREFHAALRKTFGTDFAAGKQVIASNVRGGDAAFGADRIVDGDKETYWAADDGITNPSIEVDLGEEREFNVVRMEEMIGLGQRVAEYKLDVWDGASQKWKEVNRGFTIGHRKLDRFPTVKSSKVRLTITKARACPTLRAMGVHLDSVSPEEHFEPAHANMEVTHTARTAQPRN